MGILKRFFTHSSHNPFPEMPKEEPPDPNESRELPETVRSARRNMMVMCALCLGWSSAQFGVNELKLSLFEMEISLRSTSIPLVIAASLIYLTVRFWLEYAMMPRKIRRWPLAQFDFRICTALSKFSLLAVAAGSLNQSLMTVIYIAVALACLAFSSLLLTAVLMFITMPVRVFVRKRAGARSSSVASAALEALVWAEIFSIFILAVGILLLGILSYTYSPLSSFIWTTPPSPYSLLVFVIVLILVFLSKWLLRPVINKVFAERPGYFTERDEEGRIVITIVGKEREPLL